MFLEISKAFDQIWHDGLLYTLKLLGICGRYYKLIQSFLNNRHQRVVLNGQSSKWSLAEAGVLQGSILGPPLFLIYINDFPQGLRCNAKLFPDDSSLFLTITKPAISSSNLNEDLRKIAQWAYQWKKKNKKLFISRKKNDTSHPSQRFNNARIQR